MSKHRPPRKKAALSLQEFLTVNYGEIDVSVGYGKDRLHVYVQRGKKYMKVVPEEWEGWPVETKWIGKVRPLA